MYALLFVGALRGYFVFSFAGMGVCAFMCVRGCFYVFMCVRGCLCVFLCVS